jgi:hypothetical protein
MNTKLIIFIGLVAIAGMAIYSFYSKKNKENKAEDTKSTEIKKSTDTLPTPVDTKTDTKKSTFNIKIPENRLIGRLTKKDIISFINKNKIEQIAKETKIPVKKFLTPEDIQQAKECVKYLRAFNKLGKIDILSYYDMLVDLPLAIWLFSEPMFGTKSMHYLQIDEVDRFMNLRRYNQVLTYDEAKQLRSYLQDWNLENTSKLKFDRAFFKPSNNFRYPYPEGAYKFYFPQKPLKPCNRVHHKFIPALAGRFTDDFVRPQFKPHYIQVIDPDWKLARAGEYHLYSKNIKDTCTVIELDNNFWESALGNIVLFVGTFALNYFASYLVAIAIEYAKQLAEEIVSDSLKELTKEIIKQGSDIIGKLKDQISDYSAGYGTIISKAVAISGIESQHGDIITNLLGNKADEINNKIRFFSEKLINANNEKDFDFYNRVLIEFPTWEAEK